MARKNLVLTVGSLFAGIGGFDLGFERAGFKTVWQVEIDPYCRKVLERHFPHAQRFNDVRECGAHNLVPVDVICGGFPCQDISNAGKRAGIDGERSGLWSEFARIIGELRPRFVVVENVAALLGRGMGRVLGDLAEIGYDAEWQIISAADVGAPHLRERIWILAYTMQRCGRAESRQQQAQWPAQPDSSCQRDVAYASCKLLHGGGSAWDGRGESADSGCDMADAKECGRGTGRPGRSDPSGARQSEQPLQDVGNAVEQGLEGYSGDGASREGWTQQDRSARAASLCGESAYADFFAPIRVAIARGKCGEWLAEPNVGRVAHGIPARVDRLKALGNAVVPQIPELIALRILEVMA